jgi:hypothetical protein
MQTIYLYLKTVKNSYNLIIAFIKHAFDFSIIFLLTLNNKIFYRLIKTNNINNLYRYKIEANNEF